MKKGFIFLLAILYITLTSGVVVNIHYCMGRLTEVTYGHEGDHACDKCGMEKKDGCCETEQKIIKADSDHLAAKTLTAPVFFTALAPSIYPEIAAAKIFSQKHFNCQYHSPPDFRSNDLGVYNSIFRI